MQNKTLTDS